MKQQNLDDFFQRKKKVKINNCNEDQQEEENKIQQQSEQECIKQENDLKTIENMNFDKKMNFLIKNVAKVKGLFYIEDFISKQEERFLIHEINKKQWNLSLKRRTQHYGHQYDYAKKNIDQQIEIEKIPSFCNFLLDRFKENKQKNLIDQILDDPDQLIINEYEPGQGISPHIDRPDNFTEKVMSLSLQSDCIMDFTQDQKHVEQVLKKRSLVILTDEARFKWKHSIAGRKSDCINGVKQQRNIRISLTFRKLIAK